MSRSAGSLITTDSATFIPPRFIPGYRGYCPSVKFDYGGTHGNASAKYFQDYRSSVLNTSASNCIPGRSFPAHYTHNPDLVISNRCRYWDRWLFAPKSELSNIDHDRSEQLYRFYDLSQKQREYCKDKSGTLKGVHYFKLPISAEELFCAKDDIFHKKIRLQAKMEIDGDGDIHKNKRGLPLDKTYDRLIKYHHVF